MKKYFNYFVIFLSLNFLFSAQVLSANCTDISGSTVTFSTDCSVLVIEGDGSNVTINSGVTISSADADSNNAVATGNSTNTIITNNGIISAGKSRALRTSGGHIAELINNGTITAAGTNSGGNEGVRNGGTITTLTNAGIISANVNYGLNNTSSGTITTITNSGTISASGHSGLRNYRGTIGTITNSGSGTISAVGKWGLYNNGTIETITNSGTISAGNTDNDKDYGLFNSGTIETITNSGIISATNRYGLYNSGTITLELSNSGTISAGTNYAIANTGSIETLTNTDTIKATIGTIDISNQGSITTFNNLQGKSGLNPVTFIKSLPTNYNVIVYSPSNYGQIEFSSFSGQTNTSLNFGVHSTSTLVADTTYLSVLSGLSSSEIASGTSGYSVSGSTRNDWTLENVSDTTLWNLVVAADQNITPDTNTSVTTSVKPNVILGINNLTSVTEVNFANMNTYDCDLFGQNNICLSLGSRYTSINTPKTSSDSVVWVGGYKLSDTLRVAGFYHSNLSHKTPESFKLSDKTPLIGAVVVWNQNPNKLGYQLKLANAYQQKNATLTREVVGSSEEGKGQTVIEAESYVTELQYGYQFSDDTVLRPYLAARSAVIRQDAYTETGLSSPLSFNEIKDKSTTVLLGLKFNTDLTHKLSLKGSLGVEHDIEHSVDKLAPTGISGLSTVSLTDSFNKTRPVVSLGFDYELKPNHRLSSILQYQELPYQSKTESNAYLYYTIGF